MKGGPRCAALWAAWVALASACAGPSLEVAPDPPDAVVFVDGRRWPDRTVPFRYYGSIAIDALPAVDEDAGSGHMPVRELVEIAEPVTPWLFPFDFAGEVLAWTFGGTRDREARIVLPRDPIRIGTEEQPAAPPVDIDGLSARARAARVAR